MPPLITVRRPGEVPHRVYIRYVPTDRCMGAPVRSGDITDRQYYEIQIAPQPPGAAPADEPPEDRWALAGWAVKLPIGPRCWMAASAVNGVWTRARRTRTEAAEDVLDTATPAALAAPAGAAGPVLR